MRTPKHLTLQKFEAIDMPLRDAITFGARASGVHSRIITVYAIGETDEFSNMSARFSYTSPVNRLFVSFRQAN